MLVAVASMYGFMSCKSGSGPATFCDTACLKDSIKFVKAENELKPYVYITASSCDADTIAWSYSGMGTNRKLGIADLLGTTVKINKGAISCYIKDTSYAWISFNDCVTGRGFLLKIPYNKRDNLSRKTSALNAHDPKFDVAPGLIAYSDRGNLFVEDMETGKQAMMTFGEKLAIDYDAIHEYIDSVHVSPTKVWARVKVGDAWKDLQKTIELK